VLHIVGDATTHNVLFMTVGEIVFYQ